MLGLTTTVSGLDPPLIAVPSDNVPLHGPVPVTAIDKVVLPPLQIVAVPLITPVGRGFTVTTALPVRSAAIAAQFASVKAVTV